MDDSDLVARLAQHRIVGAAPRDELVYPSADVPLPTSLYRR
jgi:hypothetical protein